MTAREDSGRHDTFEDPPYMHISLKYSYLIGPVNKSGTDQRTPVRKLTLYNAAPQWVQCHSELIIDQHTKMEKAVPGPSNIREAEDYKSKLDGLFDEFSTMIRNNDREALETMVKNVKRHMQGTWGDMAGAKVEVVLLTIKDLACAALRKPLEQDMVTTSDPDEDIPTGEDVFKTLPKGQKQKVKEDCISYLRV